MSVLDEQSQRSGSHADETAPPGLRPDGTKIRVLVVDDEPSLAELLASVLRYEGWDIATAGDGMSAVRTAREFKPDAVVLDVMLPDFSGLEVLRRLRAELPQVCVLFLTARDAGAQRVEGLRGGADDYLCKPFSPRELTARVKAVLRRAAHVAGSVGTSSRHVSAVPEEEMIGVVHMVLPWLWTQSNQRFAWLVAAAGLVSRKVRK